MEYEAHDDEWWIAVLNRALDRLDPDRRYRRGRRRPQTPAEREDYRTIERLLKVLREYKQNPTGQVSGGS